MQSEFACHPSDHSFQKSRQGLCSDSKFSKYDTFPEENFLLLRLRLLPIDSRSPMSVSSISVDLVRVPSWSWVLRYRSRINHPSHIWSPRTPMPFNLHPPHNLEKVVTLPSFHGSEPYQPSPCHRVLKWFDCEGALDVRILDFVESCDAHSPAQNIHFGDFASFEQKILYLIKTSRIPQTWWQQIHLLAPLHQLLNNLHILYMHLFALSQLTFWSTQKPFATFETKQDVIENSFTNQQFYL